MLIEKLPVPIALYHRNRNRIYHLVGREALAAYRAFTPSFYARALVHATGIEHPRILRIASRTFHIFSPKILRSRALARIIT